ncbi:MAG: AMP-binding protein, partial [Actinomycetes bacterium]
MGRAGGAAESLVDRLERVASGDVGRVTFVVGDHSDTTGWNELHADAVVVAAQLQQLGVGAGDHVALIGPTSRALVTAIQGVWLAGAVLVTMPLPMRLGRLDEFVTQTRWRIRQSDSAVVVVDEWLADLLGSDPSDPPFVPLGALCGDDGVGADDWVRPSLGDDALAVLQFTSGSTASPKAVMLGHRNICANLDGAWSAASLRPDDTMVSWLPLYHDMGLIGLLSIPMTKGCSAVIGAPQDFLPVRSGGFVGCRSSAGRSPLARTSYALGARALRRTDEPLDLSSVELLLSGAEPVDPDVFRSFLEVAAPFGLRPSAAFPAFGMAEVCIAGTFPARGEGLRTDAVH